MFKDGCTSVSHEQGAGCLSISVVDDKPLHTSAHTLNTHNFVKASSLYCNPDLALSDFYLFGPLKNSPPRMKIHF